MIGEPEWAHRGEFSPELVFDALGLVSPLLCAGEEQKALLVLPISSHWCWSRISRACRTNARALHRLNSLLSLCPSFPTIQLVMWKQSVFKRSRISADFGLDFCWRGFFHQKTLLKVRYDFCRRFCMGRFYMHTWHVNNSLRRRAGAQKGNGRWPCRYIARPTPILFILLKPRACQTYPVRASPESLSSSAFALEEKKKKKNHTPIQNAFQNTLLFQQMYRTALKLSHKAPTSLCS